MERSRPEGVVLLHGMLRTTRNMKALERALADDGYRMLNLGYPSSQKDIFALAEHIRPEIEAFARKVPKVHLAGFSLGGLVIRALLSRQKPKKLGRVVMLGTPNRGTELADLLETFLPYRVIYGPAGQQLVTDAARFRARLAEIDYPLGVIAGDRTIDPFCYWMMPRPNDGKVSVDRTRVDGMTDHRVVHASHTFLCQNREAIRLVRAFLKDGNFG